MFNDDYLYRRYKNLKSLFNLKRNNIELKNIVAIDIILNVYFTIEYSWLTIIKNFFKVIDWSWIENKRNHGFPEVVFFSSSFTNRLDATQQILITRDEISKFTSSDYFDLNNFEPKLRFSPFEIIKSIFFVLRIYGGVFTLKTNLLLASKLTFYINNLNSLRRKEICKDTKFVAFHSCYGIEALLCSYLNELGIKTYSLTHGLYFQPYNQFISYDIIGAENQTARKVLVWGESSLINNSQYYKFDNTKLVVAGNLKYPLKKINVKTTFKRGIFFLGRGIYEKSNFEIINLLIEISGLMGIDIYIKLHPTLNQELYLSKIDNSNLKIVDKSLTINEIFSCNMNFDFAIVNNSTVYYEAMYNNCICLRYRKSENERFDGLNDYFDDLTELINIINEFKLMDVNELNSSIESILTFALGMGINNYSNIILGSDE